MIIRIGAASELKPGEVAEAEVGGNTYAICHHKGQIHVFDASCPCTGGPLGQGSIRNNLLVCPWHGMRFDVRTGECPYDEKLRIVKFPVTLEGDDILIDVPDSPLAP